MTESSIGDSTDRGIIDRARQRVLLATAILFCIGVGTAWGQSGTEEVAGEGTETEVPPRIARLELLRVGDESISVEEVAHAFNKSPGQDSPSFYQLSEDSARSFVDLYADFRVKVQEARDRGLHKREEFVEEMQRNRDQVALGIGPFGSVSGEGFLFQRRVVDPGLRNIWDRRQEEIEIAVIFSQMNRENAADTLRAFNRTINMLERIRGGVSFERMAVDSTDDPTTKAKGGVLGWITGGMLPRELENAAYTTPVGAVSDEIIRLPSGYALLKVLDREERVRVRIAHMVFDVTEGLEGDNNEDEARAEAEAAYSRLQAGEPFDAVAREMSKDRTSAKHGGDLLSWYTRSLGFESRPGKLPPTFEDTVFALEDGEHSEVFRDEVGFRIVRRIDSRKPTFEEEENAIRQVYKRYFFEEDRDAFIEQVLSKYDFRIDPASFEALLYSVDTNRSVADTNWARKVTENVRERHLFSLLGMDFTVGDWIDTIKSNPRFRGLPLSRERVMESLKDIAEYPALRKEAAGLEQEYPDFARLMREFTDGALIFELEQQEIYSKVGYDEEEGKEFFEDHRGDYMTDPKLALTEVYVYTREAANEVYQQIADGTDIEELASKQTERQGFREKMGKWPLNDPTNSNLVKTILDQHGIPDEGELLEPMKYQGGWSVIQVREIEKPRRKSYEEARGQVMGDYNDALERRLREEMVTSFKKKFPVHVNDDALTQALGNDDA